VSGLAACSCSSTFCYVAAHDGVVAPVPAGRQQARKTSNPQTAALSGSLSVNVGEKASAASSDLEAGTGPASVAGPPDPLFWALGALAPEGWQVGELQVSAVGSLTGTILAPPIAELLREFRCTGNASRFFQRGQRLVIARAYKFEDPQAAFGAYSLMREGSSSGVKRGDFSSEDDQSVSIWQDLYYINVYTTAEDDDEAKALVLSVADKLVAGINQHSDMPVLLTRLPQLDRIVGSERLVMGPVGARRAAPVPYIGSLAIETARGAVSADYQFREPVRERLKLLIVTYADDQSARAAYGRYGDALADMRTKEISAASTLFKVSDAFLLCQLKGNQLAIINGARKRLSPYILSRQLNL